MVSLTSIRFSQPQPVKPCKGQLLSFVSLLPPEHDEEPVVPGQTNSSSSLSPSLSYISPISFLKVVAQKHLQKQALLFLCVCAQSLQSCPTLCNPMDHGLPGSSVHGILQARILEWVAISLSKSDLRQAKMTATRRRFNLGLYYFKRQRDGPVRRLPEPLLLSAFFPALTHPQQYLDSWKKGRCIWNEWMGELKVVEMLTMLLKDGFFKEIQTMQLCGRLILCP